ncbi:MAG: SpoIIE family protein phosphatase [Myxococcales bacterium]|nr:SpoIIE family protein phosphatase [Myxococcales bacterium]
MATEGSGASRAGSDAFHNEDVFLVEEGLGLYVVCDGVGRSPAGEVAARVAAEALEAFVERCDRAIDLWAEPAARSVVDRAMRYALTAVVEAGEAEPESRGSATTITMLLAHGDRGVLGHRGDSRAYLIRRDRAIQLTVDHELTEAAANGSGSDELDVFSVRFRPGDTIILCSDGAEDSVRDDAIVRVAGDLSPRVLASRIVSAANRRDSGVDATVVVVRVRGDLEPGWLELSMPPVGTAFGHTLEYA